MTLDEYQKISDHIFYRWEKKRMNGTLKGNGIEL